MTQPALGLDGVAAGKREERTEYRVVVDSASNRWIVPPPVAGGPHRDLQSALALASHFVVPTRIECREIVTYTTAWTPYDGPPITEAER